MTRRSAGFASILIFLLAAQAWAEMSITVSKVPDTKTRFVWTGSERKENQDKTLYMIVEHGTQQTGTNVPGEIDVRFARDEVGKIKWCTYIGKDLELKGCKPSQQLKPDGVIKIK
jgi:hypothetical protein